MRDVIEVGVTGKGISLVFLYEYEEKAARGTMTFSLFTSMV